MTPAAGPKPWITLTPGIAGKAALSVMLMATGMFYLATGRKEAEVGRMITGAFLTLASVFIFLL